MRDIGLQRAIRGNTFKTRISDKAASCPLITSTASSSRRQPNVLWFSDFTYVPTWTGFVYVAFAIDAYTRRIVGGRVSRAAPARFVEALEEVLHDQGRFIVAGSFTTATGAAITYPSRTPNAC